MNIRGKAASGGSGGKDRHSRYEDQPAAKHVAERASNENQCAQKKTIRLDYPLHIHYGRVEISLYGWQSDINDCAVDECDARSENGCSEYPWFGFFRARYFANFRSQTASSQGALMETMDAFQGAFGPKIHANGKNPEPNH